MNIEEALVAHLTNDGQVSALIGSRVYPLAAPQDAILPLLVYQRISTPREASQSGSSGLAHPRFQLTCRATSYSQVKDLVKAVRISLDCFKGTLGGDGGVSVGAIFLDNEQDDYEEASGEFSELLDFIIWHREATA